MILEEKIKVFKTAKKMDIFKEVSPWILSKNRTFSYRPISQKSYQKKVVFYIAERKE